MSSRGFSSAHTAPVLQWILDCLHLQSTPDTFERAHFFVRKLAHISEYAIFSALLYGWFHDGRRPRFSAGVALVAVAVAGAYSLADEFHQSLEPGRSASLVDCAIDTAGAGIGLLGYLLLGKLAERGRNP